MESIFNKISIFYIQAFLWSMSAKEPILNTTLRFFPNSVPAVSAGRADLDATALRPFLTVFTYITDANGASVFYAFSGRCRSFVHGAVGLCGLGKIQPKNLMQFF
jgi:hypothetical protein